MWWNYRGSPPAEVAKTTAAPLLADAEAAATLAAGGAGGAEPGAGGATPAAASGVAVSVEVSGEPAQWVHLERGDASAAEGRGSLRAEVPEGDYDLAIKIVGRGVVRAAISVPAAGLTLQCDPDARSNLRCTGGKRAIILKP